MSINAIHIYKKRIENISENLERLKKKQNLISWSRLICFIAIITSLFLTAPYGFFYQAIAAVLLIAIFLRLVVLTAKNYELIKNLDLLLAINKQEITIAEGRYTILPDGKEYQPEIHNYAQDLDIFGRASLYQYINRTTSEQGYQTLANWLLSPATKNTIIKRQEAAKELQPQYEWRQQLQAYGLNNKVTIATQEKIQSWLNQTSRFSIEKKWRWISIIFPAIILTALILFILGIVTTAWFSVIFLLFFLIAGAISKKVEKIYLTLNKIVQEIETLSNTILWIEQQSFQSNLLHELQQHYTTSFSKASAEVKLLKKILDRFDYRLNPVVFFFLNPLLLWDLQQVLSLEKWKEKNKPHVHNWFEALGNIEAISAIATIAFNHPHWSWPVLVEEDGVLAAEDLGHPLIAETKRVNNSFDTEGAAKIALITGSNMAGKSTFLRSIGVNIVLAMMGSPVCSKSMKLSHMRVISSMRVTDNLEESTSTFYAELKKLKVIIEAVNRDEKVYLLLDEVLRGTNSIDRHIGSMALIRQLINHNAVGVLATHDLELSNLADDYPSNITNYHFDVQVTNDELYFDYKLKEGVCRSMNASILMRKIGIEI